MSGRNSEGLAARRARDRQVMSFGPLSDAVPPPPTGANPAAGGRRARLPSGPPNLASGRGGATAAAAPPRNMPNDMPRRLADQADSIAAIQSELAAVRARLGRSTVGLNDATGPAMAFGDGGGPPRRVPNLADLLERPPGGRIPRYNRTAWTETIEPGARPQFLPPPPQPPPRAPGAGPAPTRGGPTAAAGPRRTAALDPADEMGADFALMRAAEEMMAFEGFPGEAARGDAASEPFRNTPASRAAMRAPILGNGGADLAERMSERARALADFMPGPPVRVYPRGTGGEPENARAADGNGNAAPPRRAEGVVPEPAEPARRPLRRSRREATQEPEVIETLEPFQSIWGPEGGQLSANLAVLLKLRRKIKAGTIDEVRGVFLCGACFLSGTCFFVTVKIQR